MKLSIGNQLTATGSTLQTTDLATVMQTIRSRDGELASLTQRLRALRQVNAELYASMKKKLPYICGAQFTEGVRRKENFDSSHVWIIDLDHLPAEVMQSCKDTLRDLPGVVGYYVSPSGEGLKVLVALRKPLEDRAQSEQMLRLYLGQLSEDLNIRSYMDFKTFDVTRVSFLSHDPDAWFDPYKLGLDTHHLTEEQIEISWEEVKEDEEGSLDRTASKNPPPDEHIYQEILKKLNPDYKAPKPKAMEPEIPEALRELWPVVEAGAKAHGISLEAKGIAHGLSLKFVHGLHYAQLNVFHGKRGYTLVKLPTKGHHPELLKVAHRLSELAIEQMQQYQPDAGMQITYQRQLPW